MHPTGIHVTTCPSAMTSGLCAGNIGVRGTQHEEAQQQPLVGGGALPLLIPACIFISSIHVKRLLTSRISACMATVIVRG